MKKLLGIVLLSLSFTFGAFAEQAEIVIDAVVASVNGKPITLQDLSQRLPTPKRLSISEVSSSDELKSLLNSIILEHLIIEEAATKKVQATDAEIESYLNEIARRNNLTRADFEAALLKEGGTLQAYRGKVKIEILRSKLTSQLVQGSVSVSQDEINSYLKEHPVFSKKGESVKLSRILLDPSNKSEEEVKTKIKEILESLSSGTSFGDVAEKYSEAPEATQGGTLGVVSLGDLSDEIRGALEGRAIGEVSPPVPTEAGIAFFRIEERIAPADDSSNNSVLIEQIRKQLREQKTSERVQKYYNEELPALYAVEKKI